MREGLIIDAIGSLVVASQRFWWPLDDLGS